MMNEKHQLYIYPDDNGNIINAHTRFQREPEVGAIDAGEIDTRYVPFDLMKYGKPCNVWNGTNIVSLTDEELDRIGYESGIENQKIKMAIAAIEEKQPRAVREYLLGTEGSKQRLLDIDDSIKLLRSKLKKAD